MAKDTVSQKYIIGMRLLLLGVEHALNHANEIAKLDQPQAT